ncbi:ABC transporter permease [Amorphoplanes nipponensis]|uniref:ABC transporter permease n=1 Tax=Actinoplanes nipponensis TaxID=135950 RepID=A0A919JBG7_9ACTN|nr:ABC transporter permease [Actinoplanes nipponensis]GIE47291.1 ABC transporter permease [Actinoplanes nipponensis]
MTLDLTPAETPVPAAAGTPGRPVLRALLRDRRALFSGLVLVATIVVAAVSPLLHAAATAVAPDRRLRGPGADHLLGTDELGRDVLARMVQGAWVTVQTAAVAVGLALVIGTLIGLLAGYAGGWADSLLMRVIDGLLAFPLLVLALAVVAALGPGLRNALIAIAVIVTPRIARVVRGEVLSLRTREWVAAARIVGVPRRTILLRHLLPHLAGSLLVFTALQASTAIMAEAALSFLGLGVQPPQPSWGAMVSAGTEHLDTTWALSVFPGLAILLVIVAFNLLADALRDALDAHRPQLRATA